MYKEFDTMIGTDEKPGETVCADTWVSGSKPAGVFGTVVIVAYLALLALFLLYGLLKLWPSAGEAEVHSAVLILGREFTVSPEVRLLLIVAMAGALGSTVHAFRSLYWYVGHRRLVRSWFAKYVLLPFVGSTLAIAFYLVIRGGFFTTSATIDAARPFGFAALAVLVGMFSEQAVLKLKEVADILLTKPKPGVDCVPDKGDKAGHERNG